MTWKNEIKITRDTFRNIPYQKWCERFVEECERTTDSLSRSDCGLQFARIIVELSEEQFNKVIASLRLIPDSILVNILYEMRSNREKIPSKRGLVNVCVDILDDLLKCENTRNALSKAIFELLSSIDIQDELTAQRTIESIAPWLDRTIDNGQMFSGEHHVLTNLINNGDFYKVTVLINSFVTLKKLSGHVLSDDEVNMFAQAAKLQDNNQIVKYTLCYYYQNLKYIAPKNDREVVDTLFDNCFDMTSLLFCISNSEYIFTELVECVRELYLENKCFIPAECKDGVLPERLYSYVISARYHKELSVVDFEKAYLDENFLEYFLRCISLWAEKDDFVLGDWLIPCWRYIKNNCDFQKQQKLGELLMHSLEYVVVPTEDLLDMYLDVVSCFGDQTYLYLTITNCLKFFEANATKTKELIQKIYSLDGYFPIDDLKTILSKFNEFGLGREARILLNMLTEKGEISNVQKEELVKMLI
jgi:hypothetical protein